MFAVSGKIDYVAMGPSLKTQAVIGAQFLEANSDAVSVDFPWGKVVRVPADESPDERFIITQWSPMDGEDVAIGDVWRDEDGFTEADLDGLPDFDPNANQFNQAERNGR